MSWTFVFGNVEVVLGIGWWKGSAFWFSYPKEVEYETIRFGGCRLGPFYVGWVR